MLKLKSVVIASTVAVTIGGGALIYSYASDDNNVASHTVQEVQSIEKDSEKTVVTEKSGKDDKSVNEKDKEEDKKKVDEAEDKNKKDENDKSKNDKEPKNQVLEEKESETKNSSTAKSSDVGKKTVESPSKKEAVQSTTPSKDNSKQTETRNEPVKTSNQNTTKVTEKAKSESVNDKKPTAPKVQSDAPKKEAIATEKLQTTADVNMRNIATTNNSNVLVTIPKGTAVSSSAKAGSWYEVSYNGKTGFVSGSYLQKATEASTAKVDSKKDEPKKQNSSEPKKDVAKTEPKKEEPKKEEPKKEEPKKTEPKKEEPKSPTFMSQQDAVNIWSKSMSKTSNTQYDLHGFGKKVVSVGFNNGSDARASLTVDSVRYISAVEIKEDDFGKDEYNAQKSLLSQMDSAISSYSQSQLGSGNAGSLTGDIKNFIKSGSGSVTKTYDGKTFVIQDVNGMHKVTVQ